MPALTTVLVLAACGGRSAPAVDPPTPEPPSPEVLLAAGPCGDSPSLEQRGTALRDGRTLWAVRCDVDGWEREYFRLWVQASGEVAPVWDAEDSGGQSMVDSSFAVDPSHGTVDTVSYDDEARTCGWWSRQQLRGDRLVYLASRYRACDSDAPLTAPAGWSAGTSWSHERLRAVRTVSLAGYSDAGVQSLAGCPDGALFQAPWSLEAMAPVIRWWSLSDGQTGQMAVPKDYDFGPVALSADGATLLTTADVDAADGEQVHRLTAWDRTTGEKRWEREGDDPIGVAELLPQRGDWTVARFAFRPPLLIAPDGGALTLLDAEGWAEVVRDEENAAFDVVAVDPRHERFAAADGSLRVVSVRALPDGAEQARFEPGEQVTGLAWDAAGETLAVATWPPAADAYPATLRLHLVAPDTGEPLRELAGVALQTRPELPEEPPRLHFSPDGRWLAMTAGWGIYRWDLRGDGPPEALRFGELDFNVILGFAPDGALMVDVRDRVGVWAPAELVPRMEAREAEDSRACAAEDGFWLVNGAGGITQWAR